MRKLFSIFLALAIALLPAAPAVSAQPDIPLNGSTFYVSMATALPWAAFNQTYVMTPISPSAGICVFVTNDNPISAHNFSVTMFQTGNSSLTAYDGFTQFWNPVQIFNSPTSVSHTSTVSFYANTTAAASIAIVFSGATALSGSPDTAELFLVQSTAGTCGSASSAIPVQGASATGQAPSGNPVYVGGLNLSSNNVQPIPIIIPSGTDAGLNLGGHGGPSTTFSGVREFSPTGGDALPSYNYGELNQGSVSVAQIGAGPSPTQNAQQPNSLFTTTGGVFFSGSGTFVSNATIALTSGSSGVHRGCQVLLSVTAASGTSETLNVYFQDSIDNSTWNDRISFLQVGSSTNHTQIAAIDNGSIIPVAPQTAALAAGTVTNGNLGPFLRAQLVIAGTTPSFTLSVKVTCQ